jgi:hypothetical protein
VKPGELAVLNPADKLHDGQPVAVTKK